MANPTITFRLSEYHLARALYIIRQLEPEYQLTSTSKLVKACFFDYLAKMNLNRSNEVPNEIIIEINEHINSPGTSKQSLSLDDLIEQESRNEHFNQSDEQPINKQSEESSISSVSDFSPPEDWKE